MVRLRRDIRLTYEISGASANNDSYLENKKIYVSSIYQPSKGPIELENISNAFETKVINERNIKHSHTPATNLTTTQTATPNHLRSPSSLDTIVIMCDENLGAAVMQQKGYITTALTQRLQNGKGTYL